MNMMVSANIYKAIHDEIADLCAQSGRDPEEVRVVAVSKTVGCDEVAQAIDVGFHDFGENRPDGLQEKQQAFPNQTWHFIGNIQSRKIPQIVSHASLIHSVDQIRHLEKIDSVACQNGIVQDVLLEVNSGEEAKGGIEPSEVLDFLKRASGFEHVAVTGLMTMAPRGDKQTARQCFEALRELRDEAAAWQEKTYGKSSMHELSMGMSEDWREAVLAGATIVRIGRMVFDTGFTQID